MTSLHVPADVMPLVFRFLDPASLAVMAQTCNSWKLLVYRTSVWSPFLWVPKYNYESLFCRRDRARHIGEPHALCFLAWAYRNLFASGVDYVDLASDTLDDPAKIVRRAYRIWCEKKKPCIHVSHHLWSDVCIVPLSKLRTSDVEVLRLQICQESVTPSDVSPYGFWLNKQLNDFNNATVRYRIDTTAATVVATERRAVTAITVAAEPVAATPLEKVTALMAERRLGLLKELRKQEQPLLSGIKHCRNALLHHSARAFDAGDAIERRDRDVMWDEAAFAYRSV